MNENFDSSPETAPKPSKASYLERYTQPDSVEMTFHDLKILHPEDFTPPEDYLEYAEQMQKKVQDFFGTKPKRPFLLSFVYKGEDWKQRKAYRAGPLKQKLGKDIIVLGVDKEHPELPPYAKDSFAHEYTHVVFDEWIHGDKKGLVNRYISEGIAEYVSKHVFGEEISGRQEDFIQRANNYLSKHKDFQPEQFLRPDKINSKLLDTGDSKEDSMLEEVPYNLGPYIVQKLFERLDKNQLKGFFQEAVLTDEEVPKEELTQTVRAKSAEAFRKYLKMNPEEVYKWLSDGLKSSE
ncbi:MAG: DUF2268 domain-containing putative Zn-dependent protease [Patescibacteria group bacterium]|jgi:hypothetical protein